MAKASVFLSYASEDSALVTPFYEGFSVLNKFVFSNIEIFFDKEVISAGFPLTETITDALDKTDFLIIFIAGSLKFSHSYTGIEVGYFLGLIRQDKQRTGQSSRRIIPLFVKNLPSQYANLLGVDINLPAKEVALPIEEFLKLLLKPGTGAYDLGEQFKSIFNEVSLLAEERYAEEEKLTSKQKNDNLEQRVDTVRDVVVPAIVLGVYLWLRGRVTKSVVEQNLIEFEFARATSAKSGISDDAELSPHGGSMEVFGLKESVGTISWGQFKENLREQYVKEAPAIIHAVEQCVLSSVLPDREIDNEQIFRNPEEDGRVYRMIITRQYSYHDGRVVAHMYIFDLLHLLYTANPETTPILTFLSVAVKYKNLFVNFGALYSRQTAESHVRDVTETWEKVVEYVRKYMQQLLIVEDEARVFGLDSLEQLSRAVGTFSQDELARDIDQWKESRKALKDASDTLLSEKDITTQSVARDDWLLAQKKFSDVASAFNTKLATSAVDRLKALFVH